MKHLTLSVWLTPKSRYKAAEESPSSYVGDPLGPITVTRGGFCFPVSAKKRSPGSGAYHNIIHFLANGRAVNEGLVSHHAPLIALIPLIQKILEELFLNAVTGS